MLIFSYLTSLGGKFASDLSIVSAVLLTNLRISLGNYIFCEAAHSGLMFHQKPTIISLSVYYNDSPSYPSHLNIFKKNGMDKSRNLKLTLFVKV
jgi:hypothetical protein